MVINGIRINNLGSYEGDYFFNTSLCDGKHIILIGGKNGAGKTTLFTAVKLCLYGYMSMGYKSKGAYYFKAVTKLINNAAKLNKPTLSSVTLVIETSNGPDIEMFELTRSWILDETLTEKFTVKKNGEFLNDEEVADFEKYILNAIPPELFNLYFFDGENIADFFLEDKGNQHLKDAFLTLCGYDTFAIMQKNFKRVASSSNSTNGIIERYSMAKEEEARRKQILLKAHSDLADCIDNITDCELKLESLEKDYKNKGGIDQEEWEKLIGTLKEEENKREKWNSELKKLANDLLPFIILRDELNALKKQMLKELEEQKYKSFLDVVEEKEFLDIIGSLGKSEADYILEKINDFAQKKTNNEQGILRLSAEDNATLLTVVNAILSSDDKAILDNKKHIKASIRKSAKIRKKLDNSNPNITDKYLSEKASILEKKNSLLEKQIQYEQNVLVGENNLNEAQIELHKTKKDFENHLKDQSIEDIAARAIVMIDDLQRSLYHQQIERVEDNFMHIIESLAYKMNFISGISIDDNFGIHIYKDKKLKLSSIVELKSEYSNEELIKIIGKRAEKKVQDIKLDKIKNTEEIVLPIEIDKESLSNGEKQIFIMALYYALIKIGGNDIPFIIDTPFARIDTTHRENISEHFFRNLEGQIFILSTDEEINEKHLKIMKDKVASVYTLENENNTKTIVYENCYFGVKQ